MGSGSGFSCQVFALAVTVTIFERTLAELSRIMGLYSFVFDRLRVAKTSLTLVIRASDNLDSPTSRTGGKNFVDSGEPVDFLMTRVGLP